MDGVRDCCVGERLLRPPPFAAGEFNAAGESLLSSVGEEAAAGPLLAALVGCFALLPGEVAAAAVAALARRCCSCRHSDPFRSSAGIYSIEGSIE